MSALHSIAVIHARGGSKRLPLKNIKPLDGKPLIAWCIEAALAAGSLDRVLVSTDHDGIAAAARDAGAEVPFRRPADLAEDVASELVTRHAVDFHMTESGRTVDFVVTIQPTTPFVRGRDIDACIGALANDAGLDSAITVGPIHERPEWMFRRDGAGMITSWVAHRFQGDGGISQSLEPLFIPNGAVYATRYRTLDELGVLVGPNCYGHLMSRERSVDIDEPVDFLLAETVARHLAAHPED